jgi:hypothetical protein|tara:strand:- start:189 stop:365 length:177 start_codon:yes stop_codon:yes gene_type:complete
MYIYYAITVVLIIGSAYTSYRIGVREGAGSMLNYLQANKVINIDKNDNITANCDFKNV